MRTRLGLVVAAAALVAWSPVAALAPEADGLTVSTRSGRAVSPGDVAAFVIDAGSGATVVEGEAFGRPVYFWPAQPGRWFGLVGVGLETAPGTYDLLVRARDAAGSVRTARAAVLVSAKTFETRRLRVNQRFVTPPAEEAERIAREARLLAGVFAIASPERLWRGAFEPPVPGTATSSFGRLSLLNGRPNGRHQGADFRAAEGTLIAAPNAGRVVVAEDLYFAGNTVVIDHGLGLFSLFAHLSKRRVDVGGMVARGDAIGESGATGRVTGPHLHWAMRLGDLSVDPLSVLAAAADLPEPADVLAAR